MVKLQSRIRITCFVLIIVFSLMGCLPTQEEPDENLAVSLSTTVTVISSTAKPTPTQTKVSVLPTKEVTRQPSPTVEIAQVNEMIPTCKQNGTPISPPEGFGFDGIIVYQDKKREAFYTVGGIPLKYSNLDVPEGIKYEMIGFSPNGAWFAYSPWVSLSLETKLENIQINLLSNLNEKQTQTVSLENFIAATDKSMQVIGWVPSNPVWVNNRFIKLKVFLKEKNSPTGPKMPGLIDPFLGEWQNDLFEVTKDRIYDHDITFSGDLSRVLYTNQTGVVLRNLNNQTTKIIDKNHYLVQPGIAASGPFFEWAPDDTMFVYALKLSRPEYKKMTLVTKDGNVITEIHPPQYSNPSLVFLPASLEWSPNGQRIAITGEIYNTGTSEKEEKMLYVYDVSDDLFVYRCPLSSFEFVPRTLWSPDSRYIVADTGILNSPIYLYDLTSGDVMSLVEQGFVGGWSDKFK